MIIIVFAFKSLAEYLSKGNGYEVERPDRCPRPSCRRQHCFWKHTAYNRRACDGNEPVLLRIQRFRCRFCHLVVSCLFSFLTAWRRHTARIIAGTIETYAAAPPTVPLESYRKVARDHGCARMSVWRWTNLLGKKSQALQCQTQKEFMLAGRSWEILAAVPEKSVSSSSFRARSTKKEEQLNALLLLIEVSKVFFGYSTSALEELHAYFLKNIESRQLILTGRKIEQLAQHSMGRLF
jgi:transposase-like protein